MDSQASKVNRVKRQATMPPEKLDRALIKRCKLCLLNHQNEDFILRFILIFYQRARCSKLSLIYKQLFSPSAVMAWWIQGWNCSLILNFIKLKYVFQPSQTNFLFCRCTSFTVVLLKLFPSTMNRLCSTRWGKEDSLVRLAWSSAVQEQLLSGKMVRHIKKPLYLYVIVN